MPFFRTYDGSVGDGASPVFLYSPSKVLITPLRKIIDHPPAGRQLDELTHLRGRGHPGSSSSWRRKLVVVCAQPSCWFIRAAWHFPPRGNHEVGGVMPLLFFISLISLPGAACTRGARYIARPRGSPSWATWRVGIYQIRIRIFECVPLYGASLTVGGAFFPLHLHGS